MRIIATDLALFSIYENTLYPCCVFRICQRFMQFTSARRSKAAMS